MFFLTCMTRRRLWLTPIKPPARQISFFDAGFHLVYRGQFDSSRPGNGIPVSGEDLRFAIDTVLAGKPVPMDQRPSTGLQYQVEVISLPVSYNELAPSIRICCEWE